VLTFTLVFASVIGLCTRLVAGFRLPDAKQRENETVVEIPAFLGNANGAAINEENQSGRAARLAALVSGNGQSGGDDRRDARLANAVMLAPDRGSQSTSSSVNSTTLDRRTEQSGGSGGGGDYTRPETATRLGQTGRRRSNPVRAKRTHDSNLVRPMTNKAVPTIGNLS
jgi:type IV secretion system protein VirB6